MRVTHRLRAGRDRRPAVDRRRGPGAGQARGPRPGHHPAQGGGGARRVRPPPRPRGDGRSGRMSARSISADRRRSARSARSSANTATRRPLRRRHRAAPAHEGGLRPAARPGRRQARAGARRHRRPRPAASRSAPPPRTATVERSAAVRAHAPLVAGVARHVANVRVRSVGTVGGNLAFADPHSDLATLFLVFDARGRPLEPRGRARAAARRLRARPLRDRPPRRRDPDGGAASALARPARRAPI